MKNLIKKQRLKFEFGDKRLNKRTLEFLSALETKRSVVINQLGSDWTEKMAFYRLLNNEKVSLSMIQEGLINSCQEMVSESEHYLMLQDTTQLNYENHSNRIQPNTGLGVIGNMKDLGFFLHPSLVMNAESMECVGFSDVQMWTRDSDSQRKYQRDYKNISIVEKESFIWLESVENSKSVLSKAKRVTAVADRESDMFELFALVPDSKTDLLSRSTHNRRIEVGEERKPDKLFSHMANRPCVGSFRLKIQGDIRTGRSSREALIEVRHSEVWILPPSNLVKQGYETPIKVTVVEAKESFKK